VHQSPVLSNKVQVAVLGGGHAYCISDVEASGHSAYYLGGSAGTLTHLAGTVPYQVTLVHSTAANAAALCAAVR
jgi:hypothetical protein